MPYLHFELSNQREDTRKIIREVHDSKNTAENAKRNAPGDLTSRSQNRRYTSIQRQNGGNNLLTETSCGSGLSSLNPGTIQLPQRPPITMRGQTHGIENSTYAESLIKVRVHHQHPLQVHRPLGEFYHRSQAMGQGTYATKSNTSEKSLIKAYLHHQRPLHVRRSLDEFNYLSLKESTMIERDLNQVVYKFKEEEQETGGNAQDEDQVAPRRRGDKDRPHKEGNYPIVMVDQLWMWIIGNGEISL